jgi:hypothetical protein
VEICATLQGLTSLPSNRRKSRKAGATAPALLFHAEIAVQIGPSHFGTRLEKPVIPARQSLHAILDCFEDLPLYSAAPFSSMHLSEIID